MKSGTWRVKAVLVALGVAAVAAAAALGPRLAFSYSKQRAMNELGAAAGVACPRLAPGVRRIARPADQGETVTADVAGWAFSLPKDEFELSPEPGEPGVFVGRRLTVKIDGVRDKRPAFKAGFRPSNSQVRQYFREADPHEILAAAFGSTPADIERAQTPEQLQKSLYLLLLRSALQTHGAQRLWQRIEVRNRRGFLSGDATSKILVATIYLPQIKEFAEIVILPEPEATMDDIYACLAWLDIQPAPAGKPTWPCHLQAPSW